MTARGVLLGLVVAASATGCLAIEPVRTDSPTGRPTAPSATFPLDDRPPGVLAFALAEDPRTFLPLGEDEATRRITALLYDPLYRLDQNLRPRPAAAAELPAVSEDGTSWTIPLRRGIRFHDGSALDADDVVFTLRLAASPNCPFPRDVCAATSGTLVEASADGASSVRLRLARASSPFLATALSRLSILPERAITTDVERIMGSAASLGQRAVTLAERIAAATNADECLDEEPPASCDIASYIAELEELIRGVGGRAPPTELYRDPQSSGVDESSYAAALLELVQALARAVPADGIDRVAAAIPLVRQAQDPVGSGPFSLADYTPGQRIELEAHTGHMPQAPRLAGVRVLILPDPAAAATALRAGTVDWLPRVSPEQVAELEQEQGLRVVGHAEPAERIIVFNVRPGRVYDRRETRQAFALCIDKRNAVEEATNGRAVIAWGSTAPWSWAQAPAAGSEGRDLERARDLLSTAGWRPGSDGILERDGERLSSEIHVRPSRGDLLAFLERASRELRECGIELLVRELDLTGDVLLSQLRWPNEFETVLLTRELGVDPDTDLSVYESSRVTSADNPGDANAGGWASTEADRLLAEARAAIALEDRAALYGEMEELLATELPAYPLWYETGYSALSDRVTRADGEIDLTTPLHGADLARWEVKVP